MYVDYLHMVNHFTQYAIFNARDLIGLELTNGNISCAVIRGLYYCTVIEATPNSM